jgi:membrane protease YdiL (CAAX protease family)
MSELSPGAPPHSAGFEAPRTQAMPARSRSVGPAAEAIWVSLDVTAVVTLATAVFPPSWHATLVGFAFLGTTWALVWRHDDASVRRAGLALAGLVIPGPLDLRGVARSAVHSLGWALAVFAIVAVPYFIGWRFWWAPKLPFSLTLRPQVEMSEMLGQVLVIAFPEEAFYRGYLQSRLDDAWPPRWRVLGANVGPGLFVGAAIFALGHLATIAVPARLAVFFPALVFGWLRARTNGIGASIAFHALCNLYAQALGRGYGVY